MLANMTLDGMVRLLKKNYWTNPNGTINRRHNNDKVNLVRYADDITVTARSKEVLEEIKELIEDFLNERGLELSRRKTQITHISQGFNFLGWNFRKYSGKLLIKPAKEAYHSIINRIRELIKKNNTENQDTLIKILNPVIRGWCNYHSSACSKASYQKLDRDIFQALWSWAKRRHPKRAKQWIKDRYWQTSNTRGWIFATEDERLIFASDTKITRHRLIKFAANPYLQEYEDYYRNRRLKLN
nr:group II intron maturase-specific domain-containing protein [Candidatus Frackibacter sp. WG12]